MALLLILMLHHYTLVVAGPRTDGILAVTDTGARTVTLYEYDGEPKQLIRKAEAYEVGHVLDVDCLTNRQRRYWMRLRHLHHGWWAPTLAPENGYGAGDFADVWSAFRTHSSAYAQGRLPDRHDIWTLAIRFHFRQGVC